MRLETSIKPKIQKMTRITDNNGKQNTLEGHMQTMKLHQQVLCWYYRQTKKFIIHPECMVANHKITYQFIHNLKSNPNKVHDLTGEMKKSFLKQRLETSIKPRIQKITRITENNGKTEILYLR